MVRNLLITCLAIVAVIITVTFFVTIPRDWKQSPSIDRTADEDLQNEIYEYELKDYEGKLAVFFYGEQYPQLSFDVYIRTLPEWDRKQLKEGILIKDYEELLKRIEDYSS